jgi:hypothetical protein
VALTYQEGLTSVYSVMKNVADYLHCNGFIFEWVVFCAGMRVVRNMQPRRQPTESMTDALTEQFTWSVCILVATWPDALCDGVVFCRSLFSKESKNCCCPYLSVLLNDGMDAWKCIALMTVVELNPCGITIIDVCTPFAHLCDHWMSVENIRLFLEYLPCYIDT